MGVIALMFFFSPHTFPTLDPTVEHLNGDGEIIRLRYPAAAQYNLRIDQGHAGLRVDGRFVQPLQEGKRVGPRTWLGSYRSGRRFLDVVLIPAGETHVATFLDGESGEVLAVATFRRDEGELRHGGKLYRRRALAFERKALLGRGPALTAVVKKTTRLPKGTVVLEPVSGGTVVRTDPLGLEVMVFGPEQHAPQQVSAEMPWRYADPEYLRMEHEAPALDLAAHYKNIHHVEAILTRWATEFPDRARLESIGRSHQGHPILALALGNFSAETKLLFNGSHHGDEPLTVDAVLQIGEELLTSEQPLARRVMANATVWLVPMVNPDGNHAFLNASVRAGRKNGRDTDGDGRRGVLDGVDLNRNYPTSDWTQCRSTCTRNNPEARDYRGPEPASEPETRAMIRLAVREKFNASISYHMGLVAVLLPHPIQGGHGELGALGDSVAKALGRHPSGIAYRCRESNPSVRGADQDYHWHANQTLALLVEMHGWPPPNDAGERRRVLRSVRPAWRAVAEWVFR